jgi:hypothetical protein
MEDPLMVKRRRIHTWRQSIEEGARGGGQCPKYSRDVKSAEKSPPLRLYFSLLSNFAFIAISFIIVNKN